MVASALTELGRNAVAMGRPERAVPLLERAVVVAVAAFGPSHSALAGPLVWLAAAHRDLGAEEEANDVLRRLAALGDELEGISGTGLGAFATELREAGFEDLVAADS